MPLSNKVTMMFARAMFVVMLVLPCVRGRTIDEGIFDYGINDDCRRFSATCTSLYMSNDGLTGTMPTSLWRLAALTYLDLSENAITGTMPTEIGLMTALKYLNLGGNALIGPIPRQLGRLIALTVLHLSNNTLGGTIPSQLAQLTRLTHMGLSDNALTGTIPDELESRTNLFCPSRELSKGNNLVISRRFEDQYWYRACIANPSTCTSMYACTYGSSTPASDRITGTLPTELGLLQALTFLTVDFQAVAGTLPTELGKMLSLEGFDLENNALTGTIPSELGSCPLDYIGLSNNNNYPETANNALTGTVPVEVLALNLRSDLNLDGNNLSPPSPSPPPSINTMSPPPSVNTMASVVNGVVTHTGTVGLLVGALAATLFALPLLI